MMKTEYKSVTNWNNSKHIKEIDNNWNSIDSEQSHRIFISKKINEYLKNEELLLDAGCGSGEVYKQLKKFLEQKNIRYFGIDGSIPFINLCRNKFYNDIDLPDINKQWEESFKVRFELQNLYKLIFPENTFDITINIDVIQHCYYYEEVLKNLYYVTKRLLFVRTWVHNKEDEISHHHMYDNIYNKQKFVSFLKTLSNDISDEGNGIFIIRKNV